MIRHELYKDPPQPYTNYYTIHTQLLYYITQRRTQGGIYIIQHSYNSYTTVYTTVSMGTIPYTVYYYYSTLKLITAADDVAAAGW